MYAGNSKVVGQVTATDKDHDEKNSVYGQIKYEFVNQTSKFTKYNKHFVEFNNRNISFP